MIQAGRVLARALVQFEHYGWLYVVANILSVIVSIPVVTAPAAFAGLSRLSHAAQTGPTTTLAEFWEGFRENLGRGLILTALNLMILGMSWVNLNYYRTQTGWLFVGLRSFWLLVALFWLLMQIYVWPILDEMEHPRLTTALRNSAVMLLQNPGFSLTLGVVITLAALISTVTVAPWLLFANSMIACVANAAVLDRLNRARQTSPNGSSQQMGTDNL